MSGKKKNKFFFFVEEMVRDLKQDGLTGVTWVLVNDVAGNAEWSRLGEAERSVYAAMTRENKLIYDRNLTPARRERLSRVRALLAGKSGLVATDQRAEERQRERAERQRRIRERLDALPKGVEALMDRCFFVVDVEYFVSRPFVPCEFGVAKFSLRRGIIDRLHFFVDPGDDHFPPNRASDEKERSERVHGIPFLTRFADFRFDYVASPALGPAGGAGSESNRRDLLRDLFRNHHRLARLLHDFLTAKGTEPLPPLFTLDGRSRPDYDDEGVAGVEMVEACCRWLLDRSGGAEDWQKEWDRPEILPLEDLFLAFHRRSAREGVTHDRHHFPRLVNEGKWDFLPKSRCSFHDRMQRRCALGCVTRWCFALFDHLKKPEPTLIPLFDFELTPNHVPKTPPSSFVVHTMGSLEEALAEVESSVDPSLDPSVGPSVAPSVDPSQGAIGGITDAFAANLFCELKLGDNFRPRREEEEKAREEEPRRRRPGDVNRPLRGFGRGTMIKKPVAP